MKVSKRLRLCASLAFILSPFLIATSAPAGMVWSAAGGGQIEPLVNWNSSSSAYNVPPILDPNVNWNSRLLAYDYDSELDVNWNSGGMM